MPITFPHKPGIIAYLTADDPTSPPPATSPSPPIDNGGNVIELGGPFSDPLADTKSQLSQVDVH